MRQRQIIKMKIQKDKINQDQSRKRKMTKSCQEIGCRSPIRSQRKFHQIICWTYLHPHQLHLLRWLPRRRSVFDLRKRKKGNKNCLKRISKENRFIFVRWLWTCRKASSQSQLPLLSTTSIGLWSLISPRTTSTSSLFRQQYLSCKFQQSQRSPCWSPRSSLTISTSIQEWESINWSTETWKWSKSQIISSRRISRIYSPNSILSRRGRSERSWMNSWLRRKSSRSPRS